MSWRLRGGTVAAAGSGGLCWEEVAADTGSH